MPWVVFSKRFDFSPIKPVNITFKPSIEPVLVTTQIAQAAIACGAALKSTKSKIKEN